MKFWRLRSWWFCLGVDVGMALALWIRRRLHLYALDAWGIDDDTDASGALRG